MRTRGTITKVRPGVWKLGAWDNVAQRRRFRTFKGTEAQARAELGRHVDHVQRNAGGDDRQTLKAYLDNWYASLCRVSARGKPLAPTTRVHVAHQLRRVTDIIGGVKLCDLRETHVQRVRDQLIERGLAPATVARTLSVLDSALTMAHVTGLIQRNPADHRVVRRPAGKTRGFVVVTPDMARDILSAVGGTPWELPVHLALLAGLRREEVLGLRWQDVDLDAGHLSVRQAVTFAKGSRENIHIGPPKTEAGSRDFAIGSELVAVLKKHRTTQLQRRIALGAAWRDLDLVYDRGDGGLTDPHVFSLRWRAWAKDRFPGLTFHNLRHGFATLALPAGAPIEVVSKVMGHSNVAITQNVYQHVIPELKRDAVLLVEALVAGEVQ
jgi:integrase